MPAELLLSNGAVALVSSVDLSRVEERRWHLSSNGYVVASGGQPLLHRFITDAPQTVLVDHDDGNKLNNQRFNLKLSNHSKNAHNRHAPTRSASGITGVQARGERFVVQIWFEGNVRHVGMADSLHEAALLRAAAEQETWGFVSPSTAAWLANQEVL